MTVLYPGPAPVRQDVADAAAEHLERLIRAGDVAALPWVDHGRPDDVGLMVLCGRDLYAATGCPWWMVYPWVLGGTYIDVHWGRAPARLMGMRVPAYLPHVLTCTSIGARLYGVHVHRDTLAAALYGRGAVAVDGGVADVAATVTLYAAWLDGHGGMDAAVPALIELRHRMSRVHDMPAIGGVSRVVCREWDRVAGIHGWPVDGGHGMASWPRHAAS